MKCSLLTLSTFIDDALPADRAAEADAHLVACPRCSAGVATLREERDRVGSLARVRVEWESAQAMLEQVGIGATTGPAPGRREQATTASAPPTRPWLSAGRGAALPWTPQRPPASATPSDAITEDPCVQTANPDAQADLPFDAPWDPSAAASSEVEAPGDPSDGTAVTGWSDDLDDRPVTPLDDWEAAIPAYAEPFEPLVPASPLTPDPACEQPPPAPPEHAWGEADAGPAAGSWDAPAPAAALEPAALTPLLDPGPPQRLERPSGVNALLDRARDFVSVRFALARSQTADDDLDTIPPLAPQPLRPVRSEAPDPMPALRPAAPIRGFEEPDVAAALPVAPVTAIDSIPVAPDPLGAAYPAVEPHPSAPAAAQPALEVPAPAPLTPAAARAEAIRALRHFEDERASAVPEDWNAFGAAAYQHTSEPATRATSQKVGRHVRQVRRQPVPIRARLAPLVSVLRRAVAVGAGRAVAGARGAAGLLRGVGARASSSLGSAAATGGRAAGTRARMVTVSPRIAAAGGVAVVVLVLALFVGRGGSPASPTLAGPRSGTAATSGSHGTPSSATQSTPATSPPGTSASTNAPLSGAQTFGAGATGVTLDRVRYGAFNGSQRLVFDMSGTAGPTTTIGFSDPTTLVITFKGTSPPAGWSAPPTGGVVTGIATTSTGGGTTTVTLTLARSATPVAFYLTGPERFVVDLH